MHSDPVDRDEATDQWVRAVVAAVGDRASAESWAAHLPPGYRERTSPADAAADLRVAQSLAGSPRSDGDAQGPQVDRLGADHRLAVRVGAGDPTTTFRLRRIGAQAVELTAVLPVIESFGLAVVEAVPFVVPGPADKPGAEVHIDDFGLRVLVAGSFDPVADGARLVEAMEVVAARRADVDGLNRLVTAAGLDWRQVVVLRAYRRYRRQCGAPWPDAELDDALAAYPAVAASLVGYFEARFAPATGAAATHGAATAALAAPDRATTEATARRSVEERLGAVAELQQDQVLRGFLGLIDATLRTNWYRTGTDSGGRDTIALKLDSLRAPGLPVPRPHVETFVHGPAVEAVHLRNGPIARGGIRWSDRPLDFRTEVLGLAEAQTKKNAIIVPTGAKGGFVVRDGSTAAASVLAAYREFIAALLDVTDTVSEGVVRHPDGVVVHDGDDPYLVVAADKGTATFSDDANALSDAYGFWLGDAFASGGSHGYDHKAMGITARGAWVGVRRHFRQLGIDVQTEPVRVAGVGDMSGDVFGNGMLSSRAIKVVAAFDHRHIFVDPDPDPDKSYEARARLAAVGRSSWADYDQSALSSGGGVWSRHAKEIELTPEARAALGVKDAIVRPPELISAILTAPVDLLWFGGIGTYIKAPDESDTAVGDHANDAVRVTADRVRARVIAEGGNLGVTQRGRIRYSRRGGRINTDFIDNAAGVATSDREVNLKIMLRLAADEGRVAPGERDALLAGATDEVAVEVLRQVDHSVAALDRSLPDSARALDSYIALLEHLEDVGLVDRTVESLPDAEELAARRSAGAGLIRPELAVLLAFAKSDLVRAIEGSSLSADPALLDAVAPYFPAAIRARAADLVPRHRLYPQLVATDVAGEAVDRLGVVWCHETAAELGRSLPDVAGAFWAARQVLGAGDLWATLEGAAPGLDADAEAALHDAVATAVARLARAYLRRGDPVVPSVLIGADRELALALPGAGDGDGDGDGDGAAAAAVRRHRIDPSLGGPFVDVGRMAAIGDLGPVVRASGRPLPEVVAAGAVFDRSDAVVRLRGLLASATSGGRWAAWQVRSVADDLADLRRRAVTEAASVGAAAAAGEAPSGWMGRWLEAHDDRWSRAGELFTAAESQPGDALLVASLGMRILAGT